MKSEGRKDTEYCDGRGDGRGGGRGRHGGGPHHRRGHRLFDYGELRLLLLAMIAERPRHGYELIKSIEERMAGSYTPSPGVIYPTLAWLDDMGYAAVDVGEGGRKSYLITAAGEAFLTANRAAVDDIMRRAAPAGRPGFAPVPVVEAMEELKRALRARLGQGPVEDQAVAAMAEAIRAAARGVEQS